MKPKAAKYATFLSAFLCLNSLVTAAEPRVERNVIYGMYSGLALLMDIHHPPTSNGYGIIFISGSGWHAPLGLDARPLKQSGQEKVYATPLAEAGYTVFAINHRAAPRFRYPAAILCAVTLNPMKSSATRKPRPSTTFRPTTRPSFCSTATPTIPSPSSKRNS